MTETENSQNNQIEKEPSISELEARVRYLEEVNRLTLDALEQAARLGDFQTSINQLNSPSAILEETHTRIRTLIPFEGVGFYLVNEENSEFYLAECKPEGYERFINAEVENYIENGTFAWAIREQRPIFVSTIDQTRKILLHVLTTASRVRGMFVGVLTYGEMDVPLVSLSLMSIILLHSANALESFELYNMIKDINQNLEKTVLERTKELHSSREQLRHAQKMEALGRLAGGVAHDFNNILTSITIASEVSLQEPSIPFSLKKNLQEILSTTERASDITRKLLTVSRKQVIKPRLLNVDDVVKDVGKMLSRLISEDIDVSLNPGGDLPPIKADPGQLEQILMNLAVNAQDAIMSHDIPGVNKKIVIDISRVKLDEQDVARNVVNLPGEYIHIRFTDTGVGIEESIREKIFDPFFTTKEEGKGTGLGLSTVYGIIKQNNGGITVDSTPGEGTTFALYWPCAEPVGGTKGKSEEDSHTPRGKETVLLVEDDISIRNTVENLLLTLGYTVLTASNGKDALELVKYYDGPVHLLFTDITLPLMDGRQLAELLKQSKPDLKVIFTTGYTERPEILGETLPAYSRFIPKPYSVGSITRLIRQLLDEKG